MKKRGWLFSLGFVILTPLVFVILKPNRHISSDVGVTRTEEHRKANVNEKSQLELSAEHPRAMEPSEASDVPKGEDESDKLKPLSLEQQSALIEKKYLSVLNRKGFTEHEAEVIVRLELEQKNDGAKDSITPLEKAAKELHLNDEKKKLLDEAWDETMLGLVEFTVDDISTCLSRRLSTSSSCVKAVLEDFLKDLSQSLETQVFSYNDGVFQVKSNAIKKAVDVCKETPERAKEQFRLVFVECDPM